jgi:hypothetical protein
VSLTAELAESAGVKSKTLHAYDRFLRTNLGVKAAQEEELLSGLLLGEGINLAWGFSPQLQALDSHIFEHYHAGLAALMVREPIATGLGVALISADIITPTLLSNPFGLGEPEPNRSIGLSIGMMELGVLAVQNLWNRKKKR